MPNYYIDSNKKTTLNWHPTFNTQYTIIDEHGYCCSMTPREADWVHFSLKMQQEHYHLPFDAFDDKIYILARQKGKNAHGLIDRSEWFCMLL